MFGHCGTCGARFVSYADGNNEGETGSRVTTTQDALFVPRKGVRYRIFKNGSTGKDSFLLTLDGVVIRKGDRVALNFGGVPLGDLTLFDGIVIDEKFKGKGSVRSVSNMFGNVRVKYNAKRRQLKFDARSGTAFGAPANSNSALPFNALATRFISNLVPVTVTIDNEPADGVVDKTAQTFVRFEVRDNGLVQTGIGTSQLAAVPNAVNDAATTLEEQAITINVLANDSDPNGGTLSVISASTPSNGSVVVNPNGSIAYTPNDDFFGTDTFTYTVRSTFGRESTATVTVTVVNVPDPLVVMPDTANTLEDITTVIPILANDSGDAVKLFSITPSGNSTITPLANGSIIYKPNANFNGVDVFSYTVRDFDNNTATTTVTVTVTPVNDPPQFTLTGTETEKIDLGGQKTVANFITNILPGPASATDEAGQSLSVTLTFSDTEDAGGNDLFDVLPELDLNTGTLTYTPKPSLGGTITVSVTLTDNGGTANGGVDSTTKTFVLTLLFVNQAPSFAAPTLNPINETRVNAATPITRTNYINVASLNRGAPYESAQTLAFVVVASNPALFTVQPVINATTGALTYTLAPNITGSTNLDIVLVDNGGTANGGSNTSATTTVVLNVNN